MFQYIFTSSFGSFIHYLRFFVSGGVLLWLNNCLMMNLLLCSRAQYAIAQQMPIVKRNGRPIKTSSTSENVRENYFDMYDFVSSYIPSLSSTMFVRTTYIICELWTNLLTFVTNLTQTTSQRMINIKDGVLHTYIDSLYSTTFWSAIVILVIIFVTFLIVRFTVRLVKHTINADLEKFHICVMEEVNNVKKDTQLLADTVRENDEKIKQIMLIQHSNEEKTYFEDPMFILKSIADSVRLALGENIKYMLKKKRKTITYCKVNRKAKRNRLKPIDCVRKPQVEKPMCTKSNDSLSTIDGTYESEKLVSVRDKISQIYKRSRKLSIPTYCVSGFALPQRVWIGGKWYLEDKNDLKVAYSSQNLGSNTSVRINMNSSQNSLVSESNQFTNNTRSITSDSKSSAVHLSKSATEVKSKSNDMIKKQLSHSSIIHSSQKNSTIPQNTTYPCLPRMSRYQRGSSLPKQTSMFQLYQGSSNTVNTPQAVHTLNSSETSPPRCSWGGGDTYVRDVWSDPRETKSKLNVTYSRDGGDDVMRNHVSTQTESTKRVKPSMASSQHHHPHVFTSTPKQNSPARFRPRQPTYAEEYNALYYGSHFRNWWPNYYYYGLQPIRL